ncbi:translation initiation factor IF3-2, chloroplastic [Macadamia integrifolia]|uniref:translation initiation factor IF3-2, chloroplastic n=1 Tax=Macadamia integrifolia TaxID=60698 RepID=UPI001C4EE494|nr:translation initiation factor IF3-2, chloroplastic [Macadamia integrifolia]
MAGITGSFHFKMILSQRTTRANPLYLSSLESKLLGVRFSNPNLVRIHCCRSFPAASQLSVTARSGGFRVGPGDSRRSRENQRANSAADPALDISGIRSASVRLIDAQQNMVGVVSKTEAIELAAEAELDLVILSPDAEPPVVRIMDYNKYRYEQQKKKRDQQKKSAASRMDMKELKMGYNIDSHDYSVRLKSAKRFLKDGDKVKVIVNLKGRENEFRKIAIELLKRFQDDVGELGTEESKNFRDRNIFIILVPNKAILQKPQEQPKKREKSEATEVSAGV